MYKFEFTYSKELPGVVITVVEANLSAEDADITADAEVVWHERRCRAILLEDHLALQESTLRGSGVHNLWLSHHD